MKLTQKLTTALGAGATMVLSASPVFAQLTNPVLDGGALATNAKDATSGRSFAQYFLHLWSAMLAIGGILVLVFFLWGALSWITSGGEKGKIEEARNRITQAALGLVILVGSYAIIGFISELFFGDTFSILQPKLPNAL